jgi:hypothetical protein
VTLSDLKNAFAVVLGPTLGAIIVLSVLGCLALWMAARKALRETVPFVVAFAALGVTTGFAAGDSRVPVVGVMLPAMLTLVSGLMAYLFTKEGLKEWRPIIPWCVTVLTVGGLVGLSLGSTIRARFDQFDRDYAKALLRYERVELESEKAKYLADLEIWKQQQLDADRQTAEAANAKH